MTPAAVNGSSGTRFLHCYLNPPAKSDFVPSFLQVGTFYPLYELMVALNEVLVFFLLLLLLLPSFSFL